MVTSSRAETLDAKKALKEFFGFDGFKGNQEAVINSILRGEDCFVINCRRSCCPAPPLSFHRSSH
jgi:superfamily II DNA helicase RecQ